MLALLIIVKVGEFCDVERYSCLHNIYISCQCVVAMLHLLQLIYFVKFSRYRLAAPPKFRSKGLCNLPFISRSTSRTAVGRSNGCYKRLLRHRYPFSPCAPCLRNFAMYPGIQSVYFNCKYYYARTPRIPPRILASGPNRCGGNHKYSVELYIISQLPPRVTSDIYGIGEVSLSVIVF